MNDADYEALASQIEKTCNQLEESELFAKNHFPEIRWDFSKLVTHLNELSGLVRARTPNKACEIHQDLMMASPGRLLAMQRRDRPFHVVKKWAVSAGRVRSKKKTIASRNNLILARAAKREQVNISDNILRQQIYMYDEAAQHIRAIKTRIRRLKNNEIRSRKGRWYLQGLYSYVRENEVEVLERLESRYPMLRNPRRKVNHKADIYVTEDDRRHRLGLWESKGVGRVRYLLRFCPVKAMQNAVSEFETILSSNRSKPKRLEYLLNEFVLEMKFVVLLNSKTADYHLWNEIYIALKNKFVHTPTSSSHTIYRARSVARCVLIELLEAYKQSLPIWSDDDLESKLRQRIASILLGYSYGNWKKEGENAVLLFDAAKKAYERWNATANESMPGHTSPA